MLFRKTVTLFSASRPHSLGTVQSYLCYSTWYIQLPLRKKRLQPKICLPSFPRVYRCKKAFLYFCNPRNSRKPTSESSPSSLSQHRLLQLAQSVPEEGILIYVIFLFQPSDEASRLLHNVGVFRPYHRALHLIVAFCQCCTVVPR